MMPFFEELDYRRTPMGELVLQRRRVAALGGIEAYEVKLNDEYLMSSLFHDAEVALADLALGRLGGNDWSVVVGGLGLGYTAAAALRFKQMRRLVVVESLQPVIDWHLQGIVPNGRALSEDPRCTYRHGDFFSLALGGGFDQEEPGTQFDAVLLDIDHTPEHVLAADHADFYTEPGLQSLARFLQPEGIFALWSNEAPNPNFIKTLERVFVNVEGLTINFKNPLQKSESLNGIYLASKPRV